MSTERKTSTQLIEQARERATEEDDMRMACFLSGLLDAWDSGTDGPTPPDKVPGADTSAVGWSLPGLRSDYMAGYRAGDALYHGLEMPGGGE